jgi:hypothetical protein
MTLQPRISPHRNGLTLVTPISDIHKDDAASIQVKGQRNQL